MSPVIRFLSFPIYQYDSVPLLICAIIEISSTFHLVVWPIVEAMEKMGLQYQVMDGCFYNLPEVESVLHKGNQTVFGW